MSPHPLFRVSARGASRAGPLVRAEPLGSYDPSGFTLLTIFVHGYNNDVHRAQDRWDYDTWPALRGLTSQPIDGVILFFWPGDAFAFKLLSAAGYFSRVQVAIDAGVELGRYLRRIADQNPGLRVQFVGHSLGCRVVLSAVRELGAAPRVVPVITTLLMGAAVPEGDCGPGGPWSARTTKMFGAAAARPGGPRGDVVLYSRDDTILSGVFRVGEAAARGPDVTALPPPDAVGLTGGPRDRWAGEKKSCGLQHDDYPQHETALRHVAAMFGPLTSRPLAEQAASERHPAQQWPDEHRPDEWRPATVPALA